jgi:hypothetical protein
VQIRFHRYIKPHPLTVNHDMMNRIDPTPLQRRPPSRAEPTPAESIEERVELWRRWVEHEENLPEAALDEALVQLLDQIRQSL